jgi:hypothetical protein
VYRRLTSLAKSRCALHHLQTPSLVGPSPLRISQWWAPLGHCASTTEEMVLLPPASITGHAHPSDPAGRRDPHEGDAPPRP